MKQHCCQYTLIRFAPFTETEEFANVGLALFVPALGELHFRLAPAGFGRVSQCFGLLESGTFSRLRDPLKEELERLEAELPHVSGTGIGNQIFMDFTRRQSGLLHFSAIRVIRAENPAETVERLYKHYMGGSFNNSECRARVLERNLQETLRRFRLERYYREDKIRAGLAEFRMSFVHRDEHECIKGAIQPLAFDRKALSSQVEHADVWLARARHMLEAEVPPEALLFAVDWDSVIDARMTVYLRILEHRIREMGMNTAAASNMTALVEFARGRV